MTEYLDLDDLLEIARVVIGADFEVGDYGLLESALARPRASVFGQDAYPELHPPKPPHCCTPWPVIAPW